MGYRAAVEELKKWGLKETAAQNWAHYLTRDGRATNAGEVQAFVENTLKGARKREQDRKARQPEFLTTPEENFHE